MKILAMALSGKGVNCPVCEKSFRKFVSYGRFPVRKNALCPNCLALERHRIIWLYLKNKTNFFTDELKVLHVAPEHCFIERFERLPNIDYITADMESPLAKVHMDVHNIPFEDGTFDVVFCNHVLEHVEDDVKVLKEFYRVLKKDGWAILISPINKNLESTYEDPTISDPKEREKAFGQSDHVRMYGRDYKHRLELSGFEVIQDNYVEELGQEKIKQYALTKEDIYYCVKGKFSLTGTEKKAELN